MWLKDQGQRTKELPSSDVAEADEQGKLSGGRRKHSIEGKEQMSGLSSPMGACGLMEAGQEARSKKQRSEVK